MRGFTLYSFLDNELRSQISAKDFNVLKKKIVDIFKGVSGWCRFGVGLVGVLVWGVLIRIIKKVVII